MGVKEAFNFHQYKNLQAPQAEHALSLYRVHKLLEALLKVCPDGTIKYKFLKASMDGAKKTFGDSVLACQGFKDSNGPGQAADCITVILNHWRRVTKSSKAWEKCCSKLDESQTKILEDLKNSAGENTSSSSGEKRALKVNDSAVSNVTLDSKGMPAMLQTPDPKLRKKVSSPPMGFSQVSVDSDGLPKVQQPFDQDAEAASPPPLKKEEWRDQTFKKPAAKGFVDKKVKAKEGAFHVDSLKIGGGTNVSYIQHKPDGPSLRLIVQISAQMASRTTKTHRQLIDMLFPLCKKAGATKESIMDFVMSSRQQTKNPQQEYGLSHVF